MLELKNIKKKKKKKTKAYDNQKWFTRPVGFSIRQKLQAFRNLSPSFRITSGTLPRWKKKQKTKKTLISNSLKTKFHFVSWLLSVYHKWSHWWFYSFLDFLKQI